MNDQDLEYMRFLAACFAMNGIIGMLKGGAEQLDGAQISGAESAVQWADKLIQELEKEVQPAGGIVDIVPKRKRTRSS